MRKKLKKYFVITPILVMALVILYLVKKYNPENTSLFPPCIIFKFTGLKCAGCGMTRALHYFLNFNLKKAFLFNPLLFVFIAYFIYFLIKYFAYKLKGSKLSKNSFNISLYILVGITIMYIIVRNFLNI